MVFESKESKVLKEQKMFNKGFMDLRHLALLELFSTESRLNKDYSCWIDALEAWTNKLSADLSTEELKKIDNDLASARTLLFQPNCDKSSTKMLLNRIERSLYRYEKELNIGNPAKNNNSWIGDSGVVENLDALFPELNKTDDELISEAEEERRENDRVVDELEKNEER